MGKTTGPGQSFLFYNNLTVEKLFLPCMVYQVIVSGGSRWSTSSLPGNVTLEKEDSPYTYYFKCKFFLGQCMLG